jgi:DNA-binding NarL/FixJ family response regulator
MRLAICADDLLVRAGLAALLGAFEQIAVVGQWAPNAAWDEQLALFQPEVILWDLGWATADTTERLATVVDDSPPILALMAAAENSAVVWTAGAKAILLRESAPTTVVAAIGALAQGLVVVDPALLPAGFGLPAVTTDDLIEPLTARELEVLQAVAQGLSNKLIARDLSISEHTVKFHLNAILGKLGAQSRTDAVVRATRAGLIRL